MQSDRVEWITYGSKSGEWRLIQLAINDQVASFELHEADWRSYPLDSDRRAMLIRQAKAYLAEYGDYRNFNPNRRETLAHEQSA